MNPRPERASAVETLRRLAAAVDAERAAVRREHRTMASLVALAKRHRVTMLEDAVTAEAKRRALAKLQSNPRRRAVHTAKWDDCVREVKARGTRGNAYAICTAALGEKGSVKKRHRRRATNPRRRAGGGWVILARKAGKATYAFHGDRFVSEKKSRLGGRGIVHFPSRELAAKFARHLKRMFPRALKGWRLRVTLLHPQVHPNGEF